MAGIIGRPVSTLFNGQADIIITETEITDYANATLADLGTFVSVGQVVEDTTDFSGDEATVESILDEQGNVITTAFTQGTIAFEFSMANMSADAVRFFLNGDTVNVDTLTPDYMTLNKAVGFGHSSKPLTRSVGIINSAENKILMIPKANVVSSLSFEGDLMVIHCTVTAENIQTGALYTAMILEGPITRDTSTTSVSPFSLGASMASLDSPALSGSQNVVNKASKNSTL